MAWVQPVPVRPIWPWRSPLPRSSVRGGPFDLDASGCRGGENLGFLPGTLEEKIDPYMRPLYDALLT
ncbi:MAG: PhoH family protein [Collinsella sp.]